MSNNHSEIYERGYQVWEGDRQPAMPVWILIGLSGIKNTVSSSGCMARAVFIILGVVYYFFVVLSTVVRHQVQNLSRMEGFNLLKPLGDFFNGYGEAAFQQVFILWPALVFSVLTMLFYGAQLISKDKAHNALQVYFSKAVDHRDYLIGKYVSIGIMISVVTLIPSALMILLGIVLAPDRFSWVADAWVVPFMSGGFWLLLTAGLGTFTLFFSARHHKSYQASASFVGFLAFSWVVYAFITSLIGYRHMVGGLSWLTSFHDLGKVIFSLEIHSLERILWQMIDLGVVCAIFLYLIARNIKPVEVVS